MNRGIISRIFGFKWSIYFCIDERMTQYIMHSNYPYDMLGTVEFWLEKYELQSDWKLYLNYNMTDEFIEISKDTIGDVSNWMQEVAPSIKISGSFIAPNCVDCTGIKEKTIPLYGPQISITDQLKYSQKHGRLPEQIECFSAIVTSQVFK